MDRLISFIAFIVCIGALQTYAHVTNEEFKRAMETLRRLEEESQKRQLVDCKPKGDRCVGIIPCCGTLQCYWEEGYSAFKSGECVTCVKEGQKCQRDGQCCGGPKALQCDKGNVLWVDGTCGVYRSSGSCYRDGQCVKGCSKHWYKTHGTCE